MCPLGAVPAAAPAPSSAAKTAGIEGQVRARNDALDYSARASSEAVTVESATPAREHGGADRRAEGERRVAYERIAKRSSGCRRRWERGGAGRSKGGHVLEPRPRKAARLLTPGGCVRSTICPAGRSPPAALCSALSIPARPGRRFRWRATSSSARWRQMIPISGWAAPPALFTILPMPANTGPRSRPWRTASL